MHRFILPLLALAVGLRGAEPLTVQVQETAEKMKQALVWVAELPNDGTALEFQDDATATVIGNGKTSVAFGGMVKIQVPVKFKVRIEARDARYRITFTKVRVVLSGITATFGRAQTAFGVSLSIHSLIQEFRADEVPGEIKSAIRAVCS